jgi:hypothetical protein
MVGKLAIPCSANLLFNFTYPYILDYELQVARMTTIAQL